MLCCYQYFKQNYYHLILAENIRKFTEHILIPVPGFKLSRRKESCEEQNLTKKAYVGVVGTHTEPRQRVYSVIVSKGWMGYEINYEYYRRFVT
jgi:hypothetical protein